MRPFDGQFAQARLETARSDGRAILLRITAAGRETIGIEPSDVTERCATLEAVIESEAEGDAVTLAAEPSAALAAEENLAKGRRQGRLSEEMATWCRHSRSPKGISLRLPPEIR